jgi:4a-hydroxytetrahydrobiopterin dehydratase
MKHLEKFNESVGQDVVNSYKIHMLDILQDSFLDNDIPVEIKFHPASLSHLTIKERQSIDINIGNSERNKKWSEYIDLGDKVDDLKRLINWAKTENLQFLDLNIFGVLYVDVEISYEGKKIDIENIDAWKPEDGQKYGFIQLRLQNNGWQTSHRLSSSYGDITNQIVQEYIFKDLNEMTNFISQSMKVFESNNHHPNYLNWAGNKLLISLKTHSANSVTQKDWDVASRLDDLLG